MNTNRGKVSEDMHHSRDDCLLDIIRLIGGSDAQATRNSVSFSTKNITRTDVYISMPGCPPIVYVEEKAQEADLPKACAELTGKFCALPHYNHAMGYIIGIAIAGDTVCFGKLSLGAGGFEPLDTFTIGDVDGRLRCIQAAINIGRWVKRARHHVAPIAFPIGQRQKCDRREITLLSEGTIIKKYLHLEKTQADWLNHLYSTITNESTRKIPYMEYACDTPTLSVKGAEYNIKVTLRPLGVVGSSYPPSTLGELRAALKCIFTCLVNLHAAEWAHLDLRWSNVVYIGPMNWVVIDAEFARPFGSVVPGDLIIRDPEVKVADEAADCYLVGEMMRTYSKLVNDDANAKQLMKEMLASGEENRAVRKASRALQSVFFSE